MTAVEIKSNLHQLIDKVQNTDLLESLLQFLQERSSAKEGQLWDSLSNSQKNEVLEAFDESESNSNLIPHDVVLKEVK